jgi:alkanesulfonate monooxygenase SsuD/methylene tetrahydromethanopterin reductase-like flavin-dependent oxidoreductase (luciferase family)
MSTRTCALGLNFISSAPLDASASERWFSDALALVRAAEEMGWSHVKTVEHYLYDWGGACPNPCVFLAAAAAITTRIRLVTGAVLPAFRHPVQLASELAMLDQLSGGRLDAGFARGFLPGEFALFHVPMAESRLRFEEGLGLVKRLWTEEHVSVDSALHQFSDVTIRPRVLQRPHPPVFVAAVSTPESFVRAGSEGHHIMVVPTRSLEQLSERVALFRAARTAAGYDPASARVQISSMAVVGGDLAEALARAEAPHSQYQQLLATAVSDSSAIDAVEYPGYAAMLSSIESSTPAMSLESGGLLAGGTSDLIEQMRRIRAALGAVEFSVQVNFGGIALHDARATMSRLTEAAHTI